MNAHTDPSSQHATYAPSAGKVWASENGCTASATAVAAMRRVVPEDEREESAEGTAAHDEIERVLKPFEEGGEVMEMDGDHPAAFGIALFVDYAKKLRAGWPNGKFWIEHHVRLTDQIWGRLDLGHWDAESATVTVEDYKNGFLGVDAKENEQFRIYAAALIKQYNLPAKWVRYACVQPNDFMPVPRVKQWAEPVADLMAFAERVAKIPDNPLSFRFGSHCRDCPLFGHCEPTKDVLAQFTTVISTGANPTSEQIPLFLACKKPIDHFFESLTKNGTKKALAGNIPPGMGLFTAAKHRVWLSEVAAREAIIAQKGVEALKPPTPAQAEAMGINVEGLTDKPEGGPVLAFANDKRPPWKPKSVTEMFAGVVSNAAQSK